MGLAIKKKKNRLPENDHYKSHEIRQAHDFGKN